MAECTKKNPTKVTNFETYPDTTYLTEPRGGYSSVEYFSGYFNEFVRKRGLTTLITLFFVNSESENDAEENHLTTSTTTATTKRTTKRKSLKVSTQNVSISMFQPSSSTVHPYEMKLWLLFVNLFRQIK